MEQCVEFIGLFLVLILAGVFCYFDMARMYAALLTVNIIALSYGWTILLMITSDNVYPTDWSLVFSAISGVTALVLLIISVRKDIKNIQLV